MPYSSPNRTGLELWQKWVSPTRDITAHQQEAPPLLGPENPPIGTRGLQAPWDGTVSSGMTEIDPDWKEKEEARRRL